MSSAQSSGRAIDLYQLGVTTITEPMQISVKSHALYLYFFTDNLNLGLGRFSTLKLILDCPESRLILKLTA